MSSTAYYNQNIISNVDVYIIWKRGGIKFEGKKTCNFVTGFSVIFASVCVPVIFISIVSDKCLTCKNSRNDCRDFLHFEEFKNISLRHMQFSIPILLAFVGAFKYMFSFRPLYNFWLFAEDKWSDIAPSREIAEQKCASFISIHRKKSLVFFFAILTDFRWKTELASHIHISFGLVFPNVCC